jgi:hypothetical protein
MRVRSRESCRGGLGTATGCQCEVGKLEETSLRCNTVTNNAIWIESIVLVNFWRATGSV